MICEVRVAWDFPEGSKESESMTRVRETASEQLSSWHREQPIQVGRRDGGASKEGVWEKNETNGSM